MITEEQLKSINNPIFEFLVSRCKRDNLLNTGGCEKNVSRGFINNKNQD